MSEPTPRNKMSHTGKLLRGLKWYSHRDIDGILPKVISEDENKMCDVDYYLEFIKGKDVKSVNKILLNVRYFERGITKAGTTMKSTKKIVNELKGKLDSIKPKEEKPKQEVKVTKPKKVE